MSRQFQWKHALQRYGANVGLEKTVPIKGAKVIVDVVAKVEGKTFLVEIGNVNDKRKHALLAFYSEKPNIEFIHEDYGEDKMPIVLEQIQTYLNSEEHKISLHRRLERQRKWEESIKKYQTNRALGLTLWTLLCFALWINWGLSTSYSWFILLFWVGMFWVFGLGVIFVFFPFPHIKEEAKNV